MTGVARPRVSLFVLALAIGCGGDPGTPADAGALPSDVGSSDVAPDAGPSCTIALDDPTTLTTFPDRALLIVDATTETGVRLHYDSDRYAALTARLGGFVPTFTDDLSDVDGFGVNAEAYFRFGRDFDATMFPAADAADAIGFAGFVVIGDTPHVVPAMLSTLDGTLFLSPLRPLPPHAEVAAYVTRRMTAAAGGCLEPSTTTAALLASRDEPTMRAIDALMRTFAITHADELVSLTVYPTQSVREDGAAIAADVAARDFTFAAAPTCADEASFRRCVGSFVAGDYRDQADGVIRRAAGSPKTPVVTYTIPFTVWLPLARTGPVPTLVVQHGLTSDREYAGSRLALHFAPLGYAIVAIDAVEHGEHPTVTGPRTPTDTLQAFFGISIANRDTRAFQVARLRDNFAQSTFDRLQFVRLLVQHPDVDETAGADLDTSRLAILGISAGGVMVTQHLALDAHLGAAVLIVPGGRIATMISDSASFAPLVSLFRPRAASAGDMRRLYPVVQTIVERGDPASWASAIYGGPVAGTGRPMLLGMAMGDAVMPNSTSYALARALGVPIVDRVLAPQVGLARVASPAMGDLDGVTGGLLQFDVIDGAGALADHNSLAESTVGYEAWTHFLDTHFAGLAEIRDPYAAIGLAHP